MYSGLEIKNFRGIQNLGIEDLKRINILVGRNNSGKTTILEAFFLTSGMGNPQLPLNIHGFRDLLLTNDEDFSYLFSNLNTEVPISFKGIIDNKQRNVTITAKYSDYNLNNREKNGTSVNKKIQYTSTSNPLPMVEGLNVKFVTNKGNQYIGSISIKENKIILPDQYKEDLICLFLNPKVIMDQIDKRMEALLIQKKLDFIIQILKEIEPNLLDIRLGTNGMIYMDIGADKLLPINLVGDGMRRVLSILTAISSVKNGVLLIDEIDTGLHYSSLSILWKGVIQACKLYNVQLITTTHSYECINSLGDIISNHKENDDTRLYRIGKIENKHEIKTANTEIILTGLDKEIEFR